MLFVPVKMTSHVPRSVVRFRASDNRRIPVAVSQVVATSADDAMVKLKRLVGAGSWPPYAERTCYAVQSRPANRGDCVRGPKRTIFKARRTKSSPLRCPFLVQLQNKAVDLHTIFE